MRDDTINIINGGTTKAARVGGANIVLGFHNMLMSVRRACHDYMASGPGRKALSGRGCFYSNATSSQRAIRYQIELLRHAVVDPHPVFKVVGRVLAFGTNERRKSFDATFLSRPV